MCITIARKTPIGVVGKDLKSAVGLRLRLDLHPGRNFRRVGKDLKSAVGLRRREF